MGLLGGGQDPVLAGLLSMSPQQIKAMKMQQAMQGGRAPSLIGTSSPQQQSQETMGQGLAGLGKGIAAIGGAIKENRDAAKEDAAIAQYLDTLPEDQRAKAATLGATDDGRKYLLQGIAAAAFPKPGEGFTLGAGQSHYSSDGKLIAEGPAPAEKMKLFLNGEKVEVTPGTKTAEFYQSQGWSANPGKTAPEGYRWTSESTLEPIPGGPATKGMDPTSLQNDYLFAKKEGYTGSFTDFVASTRRSSIERAPTGYAPTPDGTLAAIPGGPADPKVLAAAESAKMTAAKDADKAALFPKAQAAMTTFKMNSQVVLDAIDKAEKQVGGLTTGLAGAVLGAWPATDAYDLRQTIDTIKANVGFAELQTMRENSPTGGALGSVSENENRLLQAVKGSLDPKQSTEQIRENLANIKKYYKAVINEREKAFKSDYGDFLKGDSTATPASEPTLKVLVDKYAGEE